MCNGRREIMPTINQLVRKNRTDKVRKRKAPVLGIGFNSKDKKRTRTKLFVTATFATIFFCVVIGNLGRIIFVHGKEYSEAAYNQQMKNQILKDLISF